MRNASDTVLDAVMPVWTSGSLNKVDLPPDSKRPIDAVEQLTWAEVPAFHSMIRVLAMGAKQFSPDAKVLNMLLDGPYTLLHKSDTELVIAGVLPTSRRTVIPQFGGDEIAEYAGYQPQNGTKVAMNFLVQGGVLSTETRNLPVGAKARCMFGAYWTAIKVPSGVIRRMWLKGICKRATGVRT